MIQPGQNQGFPAKALTRALIGQPGCRHELESNLALQSLVIGAEYFTHAARPNLFQYSVVPEGRANVSG